MTIITNYICSEIDLPMCKYISDSVCRCSSRYEMIGNLKIYSPTFLGLALSNIGMIYWMVEHVKKMCSTIGRSEMKFFYYLYALSNFLMLVLVSLKDQIEKIHFILTTIQSVVSTMCVFSLLVGSFTQDMFVGKWGIQSTSILYLSTAIYGFFSTIVVFFGLFCKISLPIFLICFILNFIFGYSYYVIQFRKLNKIRGEIWAYGTILISLIFFLLSCACMFINSTFIAVLSDKYIDNLFFHCLFLFCAVVMIHKFWLSVCDYEVECLVLDV
ncbi:hypothetical protein NCER_101153 [Vairimorpha ceranae BRL01]|uniref:Uncharacterized protein n=1 Tax=Vairimorpha ceranae (strain BRL01) TaxID=578460 RepID=C4V9C3_VAIC1|nr:hypothetical protein NCER_101153 [Vairimorpha ceranae BRL01]